MRVFRAGVFCAGFPCGSSTGGGLSVRGFARGNRAAADCARFKRRGYSVKLCGVSVWAAVFAHAGVLGLCAGYSVRGYGLRGSARFARFARFPRCFGAVCPSVFCGACRGLIWAFYGVFPVRCGVL